VVEKWIFIILELNILREILGIGFVRVVQNKMNTWLIADTHFGHKNIIRYCARPFTDVHQMEDIIIRNWNKVVTNEDIVFHLGDFGLFLPGALTSIYYRLNGFKKFLIKGNHDKSTQQLYKMGWDAVLKEVTLKTSSGHKVLLRHKPLDTKIPEHIDFVIHGHLHDKECIIPQHLNVSVEAINYTPITSDHAIKLLLMKQRVDKV